MATLQQVKHGLENAWNTIVDGWRKLTERASSALTRFNIRGLSGSEDEQGLAEVRQRSIGWGLLAAEVFDDDSKVVVRLEAPGMDRDDFDIRVIDDYLVVRGQKKVEREEKRGSYHIVECAYGSFERAIPLPCPVDDSNASATYRRGVLKIELPKKKSVGGPLSITVK